MQTDSAGAFTSHDKTLQVLLHHMTRLCRCFYITWQDSAGAST